jgi:crossover junction endodeoxyribonuclease RuvC
MGGLRQMKVLGIDPGAISGAYAYLDTDRDVVFVGDIPVVDKNVNCAELSRVLDIYNPEIVIMERVGARPKQGVASVFSFGRGVGRIEGVIAASELCVEYVTPQVWKKYFRLPGGPTNKELSRAKAIQLFPGAAGLSLKKNSGRAEALLIARWFVDTRA